MRKILGILILSILFLLVGCRPRAVVSSHDLKQICDSGRLVILTLNSSTTYFLYGGQEMGIQFELAKEFADHLGVELVVKVCQSQQELIQRLMAGEGDLVACQVPYSSRLTDSLIFCGAENITHQVIVQRAGNGKTRSIHDITQLIGQDVYATTGKYAQRLHNLNSELGGSIHEHIVNEDSLSVEDLIRQVARRQIDYTIAEQDIALFNKTYYYNLDVRLDISCDQRSSWITRKDCPDLAREADKWFLALETTAEYKAQTKKYFEMSKANPNPVILSLREGKISVYDDIFRKYAKTIDWDWRMLASLAYEESRFDTLVTSWVGAKGLMQLMPAAIHQAKIPKEKVRDPEESVRGACMYIHILDSIFHRVPQTDRKDFILAAYNAGTGHVQDAMALAEKYHKNKYRWKDNVETYLMLKSSELYFNDTVCKYGYLQGSMTTDFVDEINRRYILYKEKIKE